MQSTTFSKCPKRCLALVWEYFCWNVEVVDSSGHRHYKFTQRPIGLKAHFPSSLKFPLSHLLTFPLSLSLVPTYLSRARRPAKGPGPAKRIGPAIPHLDLAAIFAAPGSFLIDRKNVFVFFSHRIEMIKKTMKVDRRRSHVRNRIQQICFLHPF